MENKLSPRVERHGEEKTLKRLKLKGPVGRPPGSGHNNIDDSGVLRNMAIEVFLGGRTPHAAAVEQGIWRVDEEFISLLAQKRAMEEGGSSIPTRANKPISSSSGRCAPVVTCGARGEVGAVSPESSAKGGVSYSTSSNWR